MISRHLFDVSSIENPYTLWLKTHEKAHGFLQSENRLLQELHAHALHEVSIFVGISMISPAQNVGFQPLTVKMLVFCDVGMSFLQKVGFDQKRIGN